MSNEIVQYIKDAKAHGLAEQEIKQNLLDAGWDAATIEEGFQHSHKDVGDTSNSHAAQKSEEDTPPSVTTTETSVAHKPDEAFQREVHINLAQQPQPVIKAPGFLKSKLLWGLVAAMAFLASGGYFAYGYLKDNPKIWKKFNEATSTKSEINASKVYQNNFTISYHDPETVDEQAGLGNSLLSNLKDFTVSFDGSFYVNSKNPDATESTSDVTYEFSSGNTSFSTGLQYKWLKNVFYANIGDNPLMSELFWDEINNGKKVDWIKLDLNELRNMLASDQDSNTRAFQEFFDPTYRKQVSKLWEDTTLVKIEKTLGKEKLGTIETTHYKNKFDKDALKKLMADYVNGLTNGQNPLLKPTEAQDALIVINAVIDKSEIKEFETWIGTKDNNVYKVHLLASAPSFASIINGYLTEDQESFTNADPDDRTRMTAIRFNLSSQLENYKAKYQGYPDAQNGIPQGLYDNDSYFGTEFPKAPAAGGNCTDYYNSYWYQPSGTSKTVNGKKVYSDYEVTFCLGKNIDGYEAGIAKLTPQGIQDNIACPSTPQQCYKDPSQDTGEHDILKRKEQKIHKAVNAINFSGEIKIDSTYHDYGKIIPVTAPENPLDILEVLKKARASARDAKRVADVRQISSGLELYYDDKNEFPKKLEDITPHYLGSELTAPKPADGNCSDADNEYTYKRISPTSYEMAFCLGAKTGQYSAGKHTLTPNEIK